MIEAQSTDGYEYAIPKTLVMLIWKENGGEQTGIFIGGSSTPYRLTLNIPFETAKQQLKG